MRLSGLETGLRERLRAQAREGRESGMMGEGGSLRLSSESGSSFADDMERGNLSVDPEAAAEVQAWLDREQALREGGGAPPSARSSLGRPSGGAMERHSEEGGEACATCAELKQRYAEHDAWLESLQQSAEAVVAANQQAQALAGAQLKGEAETPQP